MLRVYVWIHTEHPCYTRDVPHHHPRTIPDHAVAASTVPPSGALDVLPLQTALHDAPWHVARVQHLAWPGRVGHPVGLMGGDGGGHHIPTFFVFFFSTKL